MAHTCLEQTSPGRDTRVPRPRGLAGSWYAQSGGKDLEKTGDVRVERASLEVAKGKRRNAAWTERTRKLHADARRRLARVGTERPLAADALGSAESLCGGHWKGRAEVTERIAGW